MVKKWSKKEEIFYRKELINLYTKNNKTINQISKILRISEKTVFQRMKRLGVESQPHLKKTYARKPRKTFIPDYSYDLAEFFGIMLGDGHLTHFQVQINLGNKELKYAKYVSDLIFKIFKIRPKISTRNTGYRDVYFGSVIITNWLRKEGLVHNKVKSQVDVPSWIFRNDEFIKMFIRGVFDTDGSIYELKFGKQISFTNHSIPILKSLHKMLFKLGYNPSNISSSKLYLTRVSDIDRFFKEIKVKNPKHLKRFKKIMRRSYSGNYSRL